MDLDFVQCVNLARKGDADAFAELYAMVYKDLYRIALCSLRNPQDAADAVSDTVLDAFASIKKLKTPEAFKSWIVKILTVKIKKRQRDYIDTHDTQTLDDVEQELFEENNRYGLEIQEAFGCLDETERLVLSLQVTAGYTGDEIAKIVRMNPATVRSKLARAKVKLKQRLTNS